ncbi:MAG: HEPN domain-containing protein [Anaerolineae bacterium]
MSEEYLREWIDKAEEDYQVAITLVRRRKNPVPNAVCFHCQQCVEKYLKAFLVQRGITFPKTHDLLELQKLCLSEDPSFEFIGDLLDCLNPYSVEFRYPGEGATPEEARSAVKAMKISRRFLKDRLNLGR